MLQSNITFIIGLRPYSCDYSIAPLFISGLYPYVKDLLVLDRARPPEEISAYPESDSSCSPLAELTFLSMLSQPTVTVAEAVEPGKMSVPAGFESLLEAQEFCIAFKELFAGLLFCTIWGGGVGRLCDNQTFHHWMRQFISLVNEA